MINIVVADRIAELSENKGVFDKLKKLVSNWKGICIVAVIALTTKTCAEQLVLMLIRQ